MKKSIFLFVSLMLVLTISEAQTTAMQFSGEDCSGNFVDLFADLDAGKAVVVFFYMPNCASCPPPAKKIQAMTNNINTIHPGSVKGYAFPFQNTTTCSYSSTWVTSNSVSTLYIPMDSGATQVAYYGGMGMPTVVLLGGANHRIMFSTLSFSTADTTEMRDSIMALIGAASAIHDLPTVVSSFNVFPNPANNNVSINFELKETSNLLLDVTDIAGKQVAIISEEKLNGAVAKQFNTAALPNGNYFVRLQVNGNTVTQKLTVAH